MLCTKHGSGEDVYMKCIQQHGQHPYKQQTAMTKKKFQTDTSAMMSKWYSIFELVLSFNFVLQIIVELIKCKNNKYSYIF